MFILVMTSFAIVFLCSCYLYLNYLIENYVQEAKQNDLKNIGVSAKAFIGLHIKPLPNDAKLIYVRKTTAYKGVLVFLPDWQFDYHFYLPFLVQLCRSGYIIVTHHSKKDVFSQVSLELSEILKVLKEDEVLNTYPLALLMHGRSGLAGLSLISQLDAKVKLVLMGAPFLEEDALFTSIQNKFPFKIDPFKKNIESIFYKKYPVNINTPSTQHEIMAFIGKNDPHIQEAAAMLLENVDVHILENKKQFPFLSHQSEDKILKTIQQLKNPYISQFDYNKLLENFDLELLYDTDKELLQNLLQFLEK